MNKHNWMGVENISINNGELTSETGVIEYEGFGHLSITDEKYLSPNARKASFSYCQRNIA